MKKQLIIIYKGYYGKAVEHYILIKINYNFFTIKKIIQGDSRRARKFKNKLLVNGDRLKHESSVMFNKKNIKM